MKRCARTLRHEHVVSVRFTIDLIGKSVWTWNHAAHCSNLKGTGANLLPGRYHGIRPTKKTSKGQEGTNDKGAILLRIIIPWTLFQICSSVFKSATLSDLAILIHTADAKGWVTVNSYLSPAQPPKCPAKAKRTRSRTHPSSAFEPIGTAARVQRQRAPTKLAKNMHVKYLMFCLIIFKWSQQCKLCSDIVVLHI
jgi:hypothetical protein